MISYEGINFYPIPNIEKYYISKCGKVLSTRSPSGKEKAGKEYRHLMIISTNRYGYLTVHLYINKKKVHKTIHRLVAKTFLPDFSEKLQVDHIDGNRLNNDLSNLRMVTASDNQRNILSAKGYTYDKQRNTFRAHWYDYKGNYKRMGFSVKIYGELFAFLLALQVREEMVKKYYNRV